MSDSTQSANVEPLSPEPSATDKPPDNHDAATESLEPPSPLPIGEPRPEKKPRSNEFWLALAGVAATMIAGISGTVMTWFSGYQHDEQETFRQHASFTQEITRAQTTFTRTQQLEAYTAFDNAMYSFEDSAKSEEDSYMAPYSGADTHLWPKSKLDFAASGESLMQNGYKLAFCASGDVLAKLNKVWLEADAVHDAFRQFEDDNPPGSTPSAEDAFAFAGRMDDLIGELDKARLGFEGAARKDLGLGPLPALALAPLTHGRHAPWWGTPPGSSSAGR